MEKNFCVYILTNKNNNVFYVGVTSDLIKRIYEHKNHLIKGCFTDRYNIEKLVYYESNMDAETSIKREKYIKGKSRQYKTDLILKDNPEFEDLYLKLF
ncbi:MAG: GIY-YIG nuclease family protein [Firmicutes bacterium]|nr:GIY-YIG nuclease family protein [Candidatus Caballimonas caccae]